MASESEMVERILVVSNPMGLHARVATMMVKAMNKYQCRVTLEKDAIEADARSVLSLLLLAATPGSHIVVRAHGPDSVAAVTEIDRIIQHEESNDN
jgi:phosphotransferase system HPr (HPr) family protein